MMKKMLIDASHVEETRVVILDDEKLEDFDFESSTKKQLKGNIYLARVTRVEPSLQAAFVEFGGNRHGFLPFSELHPDYYRAPIEAGHGFPAFMDPGDADTGTGKGELALEEGVESVYALDSKTDAENITDAPKVKPASPRARKAQDTIRRGRVVLVQVTKEERGGKGAALTSYLSLAGRYCVLMPNTSRGGGVSRRISSSTDRQKLRAMVESLVLPPGMGVIVRTAGMGRTKAEVKRDADYLLRLWEEIREQAIRAALPSLIYAEGNLITKSIRDLYSKDIDQILVEGEDGYKKARTFMRMLMPSHAKRIQLYKDPKLPLFHRYHVEDKIDAIHQPEVNLPSGGAIIISPTEALVAIDVNSRKATKERHIEETALKTNLEAADEVAAQLRLRDLAGLIVIDFIDMESAKNNAAVEQRLRAAMKIDRARVQMGNISSFGLLEISRQRLRPSIVEASTGLCTQCRGTGVVRSVESSALHLLRALESEGISGEYEEVLGYVPSEVALYILNGKRQALIDLESRYQIKVSVLSDNSLIQPDFRIERRTLKCVESSQLDALSDVTPQGKDIVLEPEAEPMAPKEAEDSDLVGPSVPLIEEPTPRRRRPRRSRRSNKVKGELNGDKGASASDDTGINVSPAPEISYPKISSENMENHSDSTAASTEKRGEEKRQYYRPRRSLRTRRLRQGKEGGVSTQAEEARTAESPLPPENVQLEAPQSEISSPHLHHKESTAEIAPKKGWWKRLIE